MCAGGAKWVKVIKIARVKINNAEAFRTKGMRLGLYKLKRVTRVIKISMPPEKRRLHFWRQIVQNYVVDGVAGMRQGKGLGIIIKKYAKRQK